MECWNNDKKPSLVSTLLLYSTTPLLQAACSITPPFAASVSQPTPPRFSLTADNSPRPLSLASLCARRRCQTTDPASRSTRCASGLITHFTPFSFASGHQRQSRSSRFGAALISIHVPVSAAASRIAGISTAYGSRLSKQSAGRMRRAW